ncbi:hypothetical protein [Paenibacillus harenae]|uniref:hypothetical protein n=1 Tax=Paenibacillus harenae TaxID=306543 RepID=UPI00279412CE|nr:hypothetical protein [Paenibacillus harenae]MDQ0058612.1 ABC-type dipeptide/oligopeptide/nickel transport system ATPase subunit [Paenibacillus harenae]
MRAISNIEMKNIYVRCKPRIRGIDAKRDSLIDFNYRFCSSKVYGVVSKSGIGPWALSYLLTGQVKHDSGYIVAGDDSLLSQTQLKQSSCYVGDIIYKGFVKK